MAPYFYTISTIGVCLEGLLVWRAQDGLLLRRYPFFGAFLICNLTSTLVALAIAIVRPAWFAWTYWTVDILSLVAGLLVLWEVLQTISRRGAPLHRLARSSLLGACLFLVPAILALGWSQSNVIHFSYRYLPPVIEQYLTLVEAVLLLTVAAVARYYAVHLGRNLRCLVLGFGVFLSLYAMDFATLQFVHGFLPFWQMLSPILYIGLLAFWLWSFWEYFPANVPGIVHLNQTYAKEHWNRIWSGAIGAMRRRPN